MKIKVTQEHIDAGKHRGPARCPIALAIKEIAGCNSVIVFHDISIGTTYCEPTPPEVLAKLTHFDLTEEMEPFEFEIKDLP